MKNTTKAGFVAAGIVALIIALKALKPKPREITTSLGEAAFPLDLIDARIKEIENS
jgi:hypothetical protein